jgi:hypothetical protein
VRAKVACVVLGAVVFMAGGCSSADSPTTPTVPAQVPETTQAADPTESPEVTEGAFVAPTDLPAEVMLPAASLEPVDGPREETEEPTAWRLPESSTAMRTVTQGDGLMEQPVGMHQVAVFENAADAVVEATRLDTVMAACTEIVIEGHPTYRVETIDVGVDGRAFIIDYHGVGTDDGLGYVIAMARRGNAVTLVTQAGGEAAIGVSRERVVTDANEAFDQLCRYDSTGC